MTATAHHPTSPPLVALARQEVRNYLRSRLYWFGAALTALMGGVAVSRPDAHWSTIGDGLLPAAAVGLLGIVVMAGLTRSSDRAAEAAGAVSVGQGTRTLALACAVVVPFVTGLLWFVAAVVGYHLHPPSPSTAPFGDMSDTFVYANMFAQGVMSCVGGPVLGLVIARWLPRRWVAPVVAVALVPVTMVMQPLFSWAESWRHVWWWIHFVAPGGIEGDPERTVQYPGSPYFYIAYLAALCAVGVLVALYRDPEADHHRLRRWIAGAVGVAAVLCGLAITVGPDETLVNPLPSASAAAPRS